MRGVIEIDRQSSLVVATQRFRSYLCARSAGYSTCSLTVGKLERSFGSILCKPDYRFAERESTRNHWEIESDIRSAVVAKDGSDLSGEIWRARVERRATSFRGNDYYTLPTKVSLCPFSLRYRRFGYKVAKTGRINDQPHLAVVKEL